jgi:acetylornithine/N-succinyldiaminopimelate aminotransferase
MILQKTEVSTTTTVTSGSTISPIAQEDSDSADWLKRSEKVLMANYARFPLVITQGKGCRVTDASGKSYLDFAAGIAVNVLGHCHEAVVQAIETQSNELIHCSNLYFNKPSIELAEVLTNISGFDKVFFCNSGTEANEAAIKLARKFSKQVKGVNAIEVISMENSFHGRTLGALSATGQPKHQEDFLPLLEGFKTVEPNLEALKQAISVNTSAIIVEPVRGEGGVLAMQPDFLKAIREICDQNRISLVFDEIQCGLGRTGRFFAFEGLGVKPDLVTLAKGLGGGFPIGALLASDKVAAAFSPGDHGSTFGGNPLACSAALAVLSQINAPGFLTQVREAGALLEQGLRSLKDKYASIIDLQAVGLMQGLEFDRPVKSIISGCIENGLLLVSAGPNKLRFLPPLIISKSEISEGLTILDTVLSSVSHTGENK